MLEFVFSENFLVSSIMFALPIAFAALGALVSNKAGILNINIEGAMSMAALAGALVSYATKSWALGLAAAVVCGAAMSLLLAFAALRLGTDSVLAGIALNTLASGACVYMLYTVLGVKGDSSAAPSMLIPGVKIPLLSDIPVAGPTLFSQNLLFYVAIVCAVGVSVMLRRTRLGLNIRATGYNELAAKSVGIRTNRTKTLALVTCGVLAGFGGAYLSMAYLSYFSAGMVSGRGFIGLAAEAMGAGRPLPTLLFALLFGSVDYFSTGAQAVLGVPYELLNTLPYIMTVLALICYAVTARAREVNRKGRI